MTNKEAIDYLAIIYERSRNGKRAYHNKYQDAFDMAIEALKIEPCDDVVSRKAAIEAVEFGITYAKAINKSTGEVKELFKEGNKALNEAVERLKELPSAQPEKRTQERTKTHACDCISREAAIDALDHMDYMPGEWAVKGLTMCKEIIKGLPSAQPERKKGKWIPVTKIYKVTEGQFPNTHIEWVDATEPDEIDAVRCSECREVFDFQEARNWCTECGADMREPEDIPMEYFESGGR